MWLVAIAVVLSTLFLGYPSARALRIDDNIPDANALAALEAKAAQAPPQDQCFLYAELVNEMTDLVGRELASGDSGKASATLTLVRRYAEKIHLEVAANSKKLKSAELLLEHTSFRLRGILESSSYQDRPPLEATLEQLDQVQSQVMMQVFKK